MGSTSRRKRTISKVMMFGIIPCVLGIGIGQYLRLSGTIWLTDAGGFWPVVCLGASLATFITLAASSARDRTLEVWAWLVITWTWLYFPFWITRTEIPQSSAVVSQDGRVFFASEAARQPGNKVFLLAGRGGNKIVRNVAGTATINSLEVKYRFADSYIARRSDDEDVSKPLISAMSLALAVEGTKSRSARIALFETPAANGRWCPG